MSFQGVRDPAWVKVEANGKELDDELEGLCQATRMRVFARPSWLDGEQTVPSI
jgi:hypothetical protein